MIMLAIIIIMLILVRHLHIRDKNNGVLTQFIKELVKLKSYMG